MSNLNKRFSYTVICNEDEEVFYKISTLFLGENLQIIDAIHYSEKWKRLNTVGLTENKISDKFVELGAEVLGIEQPAFEEFLNDDFNGYKSENLDEFIDSLLDLNNSYGISSFPFIVGNQYVEFESKLSDYLDTLDSGFDITSGFDNLETIAEVLPPAEEEIKKTSAEKRGEIL